MSTISAETMEKMAARMRAGNEVRDVMKTLRERGDALAARLPEPMLEREVRSTLQACDHLSLTSDTDRSAFCMLEITAFAGLRDLPKLPGLFSYAGGHPDAKVHALFAAVPATFWQQQSERAAQVRRSRGLE